MTAPDHAPMPPVGYYDWLSFNSPLSEQRADRFAASLAATTPQQVLDIGCGWGELLLRVVAATKNAVGVGIDTDPVVIERGRRNAAERGLDERVTFVAENPDSAEEPADVVLCVGASHAFGDTTAALRALRPMVRPGGRLLFGEGFWERTPTAEQAASLGPGATIDDYTDLAGLVELAIEVGYRPIRIESANRDEWEEFQSGYLLDWEDWLLRYPDRPEAAELRERSDGRRADWLRGYRDVFGFAYLTLGVPAAA